MTVTINASTSSGLITTADNSGILGIQTAGTTALTIDASQFVGVGVVPSAWSSSYKVVQIGTNASFVNGASGTYIGNNWFNDGANKYLTGTNFGALYGQNAGEHQWYNAPSGTAGSAMSLTQAMTLNASGNLGIGTTSPTVGYKLTQASATNTARILQIQTAIQADGSAYVTGGIDLIDVPRDGQQSIPSAYMRFVNTNTNGGFPTAIRGLNITFGTVDGTSGGGTAATERARIDPSGNLLVGTTTLTSRLSVSGSTEIGRFQNTSGTGNVRFVNSSDSTIGYIQWSGSATSYVTSSDYRLKNTIAPMTGALAKVALLKPVTYKWNTDGANGQGFIAHELAEVVPECVTGAKDGIEIYTDEDGNEQTRPEYQGIDTSFLVATLTAAIQEQQAIIESLTQRITALEGA